MLRGAAAVSASYAGPWPTGEGPRVLGVPGSARAVLLHRSARRLRSHSWALGHGSGLCQLAIGLSCAGAQCINAWYGQQKLGHSDFRGEVAQQKQREGPRRSVLQYRNGAIPPTSPQQEICPERCNSTSWYIDAGDWNASANACDHDGSCAWCDVVCSAQFAFTIAQMTS